VLAERRRGCAGTRRPLVYAGPHVIPCLGPWKCSKSLAELDCLLGLSFSFSTSSSDSVSLIVREGDPVEGGVVDREVLLDVVKGLDRGLFCDTGLES
jgi:hypothetical protein